MKCLVSKNSVFKSVILTLVGLLCFAGVGVGQNHTIVLESQACNSSITISDELYCEDLDVFYFKVVRESDCNPYIKIKIDGTCVSFSDVDNGVFKWDGDYLNWGDAVFKMLDGTYWYKLDISGKSLTSYKEQQFCGIEILGTPVMSASKNLYCENNRPTLTVTGWTINGTTPKYKWYKGEDLMGTTSSATFVIPEGTGGGTYKCVACDSDGNPIGNASINTSSLSVPAPVGNPTITPSESSLSLENQVACTKDSKSFTVTLDNTCLTEVESASMVSSTNSGKFDVSKSGNTITVTLDDNANPGTYNATLRLTAGATTKDIGLTGTVVKPTISASPSSVSITNTVSCTPNTQNVTPTISNSCGTLNTPTITGTDASKFTVVSNGSGTYKVTLNENTTPGTYNNATLNFSTLGADVLSIPLSGTVAKPVISTTESSLSFTNKVGCTSNLDSKTITPTLSNSCGTISAEIINDSNDNFDVSVSGSNVTVTFKKTATPGSSYTGTLVIHSAGSDDKTISLNGTIPTPVINADKSSLSFTNNVGCTSNLDSKGVNITLDDVCNGSFSAEITGTDKNDFEIVSISGSKITVRFKNTSTPKANYSAKLVVKSANAVDKEIDLSGSVPTPTLTLSSSTLNIMNENGATPQAETITVTRNNSCAAVTASNSNTTDFEVVKVDDNTFTIKYNNNVYDPNASSAMGTITFSSNGATAQTLNVEGSVSQCSESTVAETDFSDGQIPSFIYDISGTKDPGTWGNAGYTVASGSYYGNSVNNPSSQALQLKKSSFKIKMSDAIETVAYKVSLTIGNNSQYGNSTIISVGNNTNTIATNGDPISLEVIVLGSQLKSGINVSHTNDYAYFDNFKITKLCPPDVKMTVSNECTEGSMTFTAQATPMSGSTIVSYQWYKNGVAIDGATSATFTPTVTYAKGSSITVKATDDLGAVGESIVPYIYDCGATIESVSLDATSDFYCAGMTITATIVASPDDGYPQYEWYKDNVLVGTTTSSTYTVSGSGSWKVIAYASADKYKESSAVVIGEENPTLSLNQTNLSFENLLNNPVAPAQQIIPSVEGSCSAYTYSYTSTNSNFSVDANGNVVFNNNTGTSTIYNGTVEVTATPVGGGNPLTATVDVSGILRDCVPENVVSDGDFESGLPSWITIPFTTTQRTEASQSDADFFAITTKNLNNGCGAFPSGYVGNVLQVHRQTNDQSYDALKITLTDDIDDNTIYSISFTMGNNAKNGSNNAYEILVLGENIGSLPRNTTQTFTFTASGTQLKSGVVVTIKTNASQSDVRNSAYFDNIQIESTCPPKVEITDANSICSSTPSITSSVIIKGSADIEKYEWYVKGVSDSDFSLLESHTSSSLTDTYSSSSEIASGSLIKVVVYDKNGSKAEVLYEVLCGPIIDPIDPINTICVSGNITDLEVPNYESTTSVSTEGWEVASSPDAIGSEWTPLASLNNIPVEYKDYYIRYYAVNEQGKGKSNAVQITMFDDPTIGDFSIENICDGETFTLTGKKPTVEYDDGIENPTERWEYSTTSDFSSGVGILTESTSLAPNTYYVRYVASECKDFYSEVKEVEVYTPHIEVQYANSTYYRTATSLLPVTEEPNLEHPCVDGPFTYTITSGNENGYFTIDASTGVISLTSEALNATVGGYPITVTATNGTITSDPTPLTITISNDPELTLDCSASETYYVYSKYQKLNIDKIVSSAYVNADVTLSLTGSDVSNFELSSSSVSGNLVQHVIITNSDDFSGAGTYTLTLTATTEGDGTLTKECDMTVVVRDIDISSEKNDQTVCGGIAETLSVTVTGEDQTNLLLTYQWYKGSTPVAGATSKDFTPTEDGSYSCKVSLNGELIYTTEVSNVTFVPNSPIVTFKDVVPSEVYCSQEIPVELSIVDKNNNDISSLYTMFSWEKDNLLMKASSNDSFTYTFDCSSDAGKTVTLSVSFSDPNNGCEYEVAKTVVVKPYDNVYYYCGPTGSNSALNDLSNWCTSENASTSSCTHPSSFTNAGCNYIINKDDVILKEGETWTVSGAGTKLSIGNGKWTTAFSGNPSSKTSAFSGNSALGNSFMVSSYKLSDGLEILSDVADYDFRSSAKTFSIQGTINLNDGVTIDVRRGSELVIETSSGNPTIAMCETDLLACAYSSGYECLESTDVVYNAAIVPGAIVTYKDEGATAIQATQYSNLYINTSGVVQFESGEVEISQNMKLDETPSSVISTGSNVVYDGKVNQSVAPIVYDNLSFYNSTEKNIVGDVEVTGQMIVGAGSTLNGGSTGNTIKLTSCDDDPIVDFRGIFESGNSTVWYAGNDCNQKVTAMPYYNLTLSDGDKTFEDKNIIGIANQFLIDQNKNYTTTGSTVEFNGTTAQEIPEFTFSKLVINNTALSNGFSETNTVKMTGDVTVQDQLLLNDGVLTVNGNDLLVTNTVSNAVMEGYYKSDKEQAFINGTINRVLPASQSGSDISSLYVFPVGNMTDGYLPLTLSQITTGDSPTVAVSATHGNLSSRGKDSELIALESDYYWNVEEIGGSSYTSGRVSISTARNTALEADNCVAYSSSGSDAFSQLNGTALTTSLIRSKANGTGVYTFGTININKKDYYYDCTNGEDINDPSHWYTSSGTPATSFSEDYATWTIKSGCGSSCGSETSRRQNNIVTISSTDVDNNTHTLSLDGLTGCSVTFATPIEITGSNSELVLEKGVTLTIASKATFAAVHQQQASNIFINNEMTVLEKYTIDEVSQAVGTGTDGSHDADTREPLQAKIINGGVVNIMASKFDLSDAWFINKSNAQTNFVNSDFSIICKTGSNDHHSNGNAGHFINLGAVSMENSGLTVKGRFAQLQNVNGASWIIDNRLSSYNGVINFDDMEFYHDAENYVSMECGSSFIVRKSDVELLYKGYVADADNCPVKIGGDFVIEDGNLHIRRSTGESGGTVTIEHSCGSLMLYDTDNTNDGIITMESNGGGTNFNVEGKMYTMGFVQEGGSGAKMTIKDGGFAFIGDMGAVLPGYSWNYTITVAEGGVMHYCGNKTAAADAIGTNRGALYYAENYYIGDDPIRQGDFTNENNASYAALYESMEACMDAFNEGASPKKTETLLPIELTLLYGVCNENGDVVIRWQTASETNNEYFTILRSFDGVHFEELDIVWGAGTTTEFHNYEYFDTDDNTGIVYYKLRQTDYDGNTTESKVIAVQTCGPNAQFRITEDQIDIFFNHPEESSFVVITSITGQIFYSKSFRNTEAARIAAPQRKGIYIISVIDSKTITSEKFIR